MTKKELGDFGERLARDYLKRQNYKIVEQNFRIRLGEIDIIAKKRDEIVFIEVKTRTSDKYGQPQEAVDFFKQERLIDAIYHYIDRHKIKEDFRVDVIGIAVDLRKRIARLKHFKNALD